MPFAIVLSVTGSVEGNNRYYLIFYGKYVTLKEKMEVAYVKISRVYGH